MVFLSVVVQFGLGPSERAIAFMGRDGFLLEHNKIMGGISVTLLVLLLLQGSDALFHVGQCRM